MLTATLNESRSCKLTTASGSASTELWPVEKKSTYNSSDLFGSGGRSLNSSNGIHDVCVGHILGGVRRQVRTPSCRRGIDVHLLVFAQGFSSLVEHISYTGPCDIITGGPTCSSSLDFFQLECLFLLSRGPKWGLGTPTGDGQECCKPFLSPFDFLS